MKPHITYLQIFAILVISSFTSIKAQDSKQIMAVETNLYVSETSEDLEILDNSSTQFIHTPKTTKMNEIAISDYNSTKEKQAINTNSNNVYNACIQKNTRRKTAIKKYFQELNSKFEIAIQENTFISARNHSLLSAVKEND